MGLISAFGRLLEATLNGLVNIRDEVENNPSEVVGKIMRFFDNPLFFLEDRFTQLLVENDLSDEAEAINSVPEVILGGIFDTFEDDIIEEFQTADLTDIEGLEPRIDEAEGAAIEDALVASGAGTALEILSLGQVDQQQEYIVQALSYLSIDDILGSRLSMWMEKGVRPALEARVAKRARSEFVALGDAHEYALRNKQGDEGYLSPENAPQKVIDAIGSDVPINPDNLLEEWGIRDDNLEILEEVGLEAMEFEELIETPAELGLIVPPDVLDQTLDLAGYPEPLKDFLRKIPDEIPRSNRAWEERTAAEALIGELDDLVIEGTVTPADAIAMLPDEVDVARDALRDRFDLLADVEAGTPSQTDVEGALAFGGLSPDEFRDQLDAAEFPVDQFPGVVSASVIDQADGDLRTGVGLGLLSESDYVALLTDAGLSEDIVNRLLRGEDLDDIATSRLTDETRAEGAGLQTIPQVGPDRAELLRDAEITTLQDVVDADPELIADALVISPEFAERLQTAAEIALGR